MKNIARLCSIIAVSALALGLAAPVHGAVPECTYDIVGTTTVSPNWEFNPDGQVTYGMPNWWEDDVMACYYTYQTPGYLVYFPACDFDGSGVVEGDEVMEIYNFVKEYPTGGTPNYAYQCAEPTCDDLTAVDFNAGSGAVEALGVGVIGGECRTIQGNLIPSGIALYENFVECEDLCDVCAESYAAGHPEAVCPDPRIARGTQRIGVILINYEDEAPRYTVEEVREAVFDHPNSIANFMGEASYGRMEITGEVFGWYDGFGIHNYANCYPYNDDALNYASDDADLQSFDGFIVFINYDAAAAGVYCGGNGDYGRQTIETNDGTVHARMSRVPNLMFNFVVEPVGNTTPITSSTMAHELFHTYGRYNGHAIAFDCGDQALKIDPGETCVRDEYGSAHSIMGHFALSQASHPSSAMKEALGWLYPDEILTVNGSGDYMLSAYERLEGGLHALKIELPEPILYHDADLFGDLVFTHLYVEYRGLTGFDYRASRAINSKTAGLVPIDDPHGALINLVDTQREYPVRFQIDTKPYTFGEDLVSEWYDYNDAPLTLGQTFVEPHNNISIETISVNEGQDLTVRVTFL